MAGRNNSKKGNILPLVVIVIIGFLAYKANPEYWQQGKLVEDLKKLGNQEVKTEEVAEIPQQQAPAAPTVDPDASLPGSVKGAKTIPINVNKSVNVNDPMYSILRSKFKTVYLVYPEGDAAKSIAQSVSEGISNSGLKGQYLFSSLYYTSSNKKQACEASLSQKFFCENCSKKICIINPQKQEYIVTAPTAQAAISKIKALKNW